MHKNSLLFKLVSLRAKRSDLPTIKLLRRFAPRNDTLKVSQKRSLDDYDCHNLNTCNKNYSSPDLKKFKVYGNFVFTLLVVFLILGCEKKNVAPVGKESIPVKVVKVELQTIKNSLDYVGDIKARDEAVVYSKVNGKVIEKLKENGEEVKKGDVIAYIDRDEIGFKFEKAPVESPLSGVIGRIYVDIGTSVTVATPIALVVALDKVKINLNIPELYLSMIALGQTAEVNLDAYPQEKFIGAVSNISPVLDLETRTAPIEILIENSRYKLKPGMFASAQLILEEHKNVPVIVKEAIMGRGSAVYVYVVEAGLARRKNLTLGVRQGALYEVTSGLKEGELVVVMGQQKLYDGTAVVAEDEKIFNKDGL
jgi:multidrug efflux pump subunit AcrA (membrane-fusion protein)